MSNIILAKTTSRETIGEVMVNMEQDVDAVFYRRARERWVDPLPSDGLETVIRWGVTKPIGREVGRVYNRPSAIRAVSDKGGFRRTLHELGIPTPAFVNLNNHRSSDFPLIVRPSFHQKGRKFLLFNNIYELRRRWNRVRSLSKPYASTVYPKTTEWRVHVAHGKVLAVQQKLRTSQLGGLNPSNPLCWNLENGYTFSVVKWTDYRLDIVSLAIRTAEIAGLDFCAVDILADPTDLSLPSAVVCEVNTAPRLEGYLAERYGEYFDWLVRVQPTTHFEIPEGSEPRHYALKHRELENEDYDFDFSP